MANFHSSFVNVVDGDFFGWTCDALFIKPMGDGLYRLRCNNSMTHH